MLLEIAVANVLTNTACRRNICCGKCSCNIIVRRRNINSSETGKVGSNTNFLQPRVVSNLKRVAGLVVYVVSYTFTQPSRFQVSETRLYQKKRMHPVQHQKRRTSGNSSSHFSQIVLQHVL